MARNTLPFAVPPFPAEPPSVPARGGPENLDDEVRRRVEAAMTAAAEERARKEAATVASAESQLLEQVRVQRYLQALREQRTDDAAEYEAQTTEDYGRAFVTGGKNLVKGAAVGVVLAALIRMFRGPRSGRGGGAS